jgi:hypothetical protein
MSMGCVSPVVEGKKGNVPKCRGDFDFDRSHKGHLPFLRQMLLLVLGPLSVKTRWERRPPGEGAMLLFVSTYSHDSKDKTGRVIQSDSRQRAAPNF